MNDAFSDKAIQEIAMKILSNPENLSTFEIDPFPQYSSTRTLCTYRKPLPPPAFPFSRQEGWCLRDRLWTYRKSRFKQISREKDHVDRPIHCYLEKVVEDSRPQRQLSLYHQKLGVILIKTKCIYDSFELCKERAKALLHEPVQSSPLRECMSIEDEWEIAKDIENFFEQWLSRYSDLYQPEEMNRKGVERSVSKLIEQTMDWESDVPPVVSSSQLSMTEWSVGSLVPPVTRETEYGNGGHLDAMIKDLIIPNLAVPKPSIGWDLDWIILQGMFLESVLRWRYLDWRLWRSRKFERLYSAFGFFCWTQPEVGDPVLLKNFIVCLRLIVLG